MGTTDRLIALVEVVNISIQDFDEELDRHSGVHAGICYPKSTLETLKHTFAISVELPFTCQYNLATS